MVYSIQNLSFVNRRDASHHEERQIAQAPRHAYLNELSIRLYAERQIMIFLLSGYCVYPLAF